jgi:hypothetical protein
MADPKKSEYKLGEIIICQGMEGIVVYPRKYKQVTVAWKGMDDLDDYSTEWLDTNCKKACDIYKR